MAEARKRIRLSSSEDLPNLKDEAIGTSADGQRDSSEHPSTDQNLRRTLFVRSLPPAATTESLTEFFSQFYPIKHATVVLDPSTKQSKGYGFVTFADLEDAKQALTELNGSNFEGRKIKIEIAEPRKREIDENLGKSVPAAAALKAKEERKQHKKEAQPPKLIVRNLPWSISEPEQLAVLFRSYGKVKRAIIPKKNGRHAGFGFVVLRGRKNAERAIEQVNGKEVDGRTIAVDWAVEKSLWEELQEKAKQEVDEPANDTKPPKSEEDDSSLGEEGSVERFSDEDDSEDDDVSMPDADSESNTDVEEDANSHGEEDEDERNASTVFIRNVPFTATDESLYEHFTQFGPVRYARIVFDHETERPRGTAFVCFRKVEDAESCVREAPKATQQTQSKSAKGFKHSVLEDESLDPSGKYTMDGRVLQVTFAVSKSEANRLAAEGSARREQRERDKRRLFLLSEGTIPSNSPLYAKLSPTEIKMREASAKQRQKLVKSNPMLHVSLTRLSVRNLPRNIDSKALKALAREAVVGFAKDVKSGLRQPLSKEELARSAAALRETEKEGKSKRKGVVRQAKVVYEGRDGRKISEKSGVGRSRGYGFIEYKSHRYALMGLRWLNGHAVKPSSSSGKTDPGDKTRRLIVEFAIENAQVVKRRREKEAKARQKSTDGGEQTSKDEKQLKTSSPKQGVKRKRADGSGSEETSGGKKPRRGTMETKDEKDNDIAKRNRIIAKKRMARKARKGK
ncbi:hypothetical protein VTO42DRAFT_6279 [Malbranchea cinnamomea]